MVSMTRILVTKWMWQYPYSEQNVKETEKYKPYRWIVGSGNKFYDITIT